MFKTYQKRWNGIQIQKGVRVGEIENPAWIYHEFYLWDLEGNQIRIHGYVHEKEKNDEK